ncbi:hypothetical protein [uncultured Sphingomonas sp.]|uniref:hypothetical protein n=1 Tax=uncultured Sphingomonas sp. TaxID=158754 RepID=UPI0035C9774A
MSKLFVAALAASVFGAAPVQAQQVALPGVATPKSTSTPGEVARGAPVNGVLVLYGNQRCPTDNAGNEIVVCARRSAQEQFRVPKELRELEITPENEAWAVRAGSALEAGAGVNTIGSCSAIGPGGQTGCFNQRVRESRREDAARAVERSRQPQ